MSRIYHLTKKTGNKKMTVALYNPHGESMCFAQVEKIFAAEGHDINRLTVETEQVCNQKMWKGYADDCPIYPMDSKPKPPRDIDADYLAVKYAEIDEPADPEPFPMVEGEGAPQYTFDLPEGKETQLSLL